MAESEVNYAASVGRSRWYGFTTVEAARAWAEANARGRAATVVDVCMVDRSRVVTPPREVR